MRVPTPPKIFLDGLTQDEQGFVIRLALEVVYDLGGDKVYSALEKIEFSKMEPEIYTAFWSLLNSEQRSIIRNLQDLAHDLR